MTKTTAKTATQKNQGKKQAQELPFSFPSMENLNGNFMNGNFMNGKLLNGNLLSTCLSANQAALEGAIDLSKEMMGFVTQRLNADVEAIQALSQCRSMEEAVSLQSEFVKTAADAYMEKVPQLTEKAAQTGAAVLGAMTESE